MDFIRITAALIAVFTPLTAMAASPDLAHGRELYEECKGCHGLPDNVVGPRHCGVIGRRAGSVPDFIYSDVMKNSGIVWTDAKLDAFLTSPISYLSGTNMGYAGLFDVKERIDLIAFLHQINDDQEGCAGVSAQAKGVH
jgi:cytochrome c